MQKSRKLVLSQSCGIITWLWRGLCIVFHMSYEKVTWRQFSSLKILRWPNSHEAWKQDNVEVYLVHLIVHIKSAQGIVLQLDMLCKLHEVVARGALWSSLLPSYMCTNATIHHQPLCLLPCCFYWLKELFSGYTAPLGYHKDIKQVKKLPGHTNRLFCLIVCIQRMIGTFDMGQVHFILLCSVIFSLFIMSLGGPQKSDISLNNSV